MNHFDSLCFKPADILLPAKEDMTCWSVVACDQYTSQPEYWQRVADTVGKKPSTLKLILPESCLEGPNVETDIMDHFVKITFSSIDAYAFDGDDSH